MASRKQIIWLAVLFLAAMVIKAVAQTPGTEGSLFHDDQEPHVTNTGIEIYLPVDESIDSAAAVEMPLSELVLRDEPWITSEDIELYDFSSHCIYFKEEVPPLPLINISLKGSPFVVTADGQRCYLGSIWTHFSSFSPEPNTPIIYQPDFTLPADITSIELRSIDDDQQRQDVRNDPRIMQALVRDEQYHAGLEIHLDNVELVNKDGGSSLTYTYTLKNNDEDDLYVFDPNKMGKDLFHHFNNCPYIFPQDSEQSITADTNSIIKISDFSGQYDKSWFSLIKSGKSMTRTVTLDAYPEIAPGEYECMFWFNSPGLRFTKDQREKFDNRVWMGQIQAKLNFKVNAGNADGIGESEFDQLIDMTTNEFASEAELQERAIVVRERTPLIDWQKERVENIKGETIQQVIENLANFDDNMFAQTASGEGFSPGEPRSEGLRVVHLSRVARLVEEGRKQPEQVIPPLREALLESFEAWPEVREERKEKWLTEGSFSLEGPEGFEKVTTKAVVATYVLAELGDYKSLPLLMQSYQKSEKWIATFKPYPVFQFPVAPNLTLYAMHKLVESYPADKLTTDAINARAEYLKWADENLPEADVISRSAWDAEYDTSDPMVRITDPEGILHKTQRKINLTVYPHKYKDGTWFEGYIEDHVDDKTQEWFDTMKPFLEATESNPEKQGDLQSGTETEIESATKEAAESEQSLSNESADRWSGH